VNTEINLVGYKEDKIYFNMSWANIFAIIILVIFSIVFGGIFYAIWHQNFNTFQRINIDTKRRLFLFLKYFSVGLIVGIMGSILHELIHGLFYILFTKNKLKSIKFGIKLKYCAAYCICTELLIVRYSIISAIMPAIILGFIPSIIAVIIGNLLMLIFGVAFIAGAAGDFLLVMKLIKEDKESYVLDKLGKSNYVSIYRKEESQK
jgi:hypothetical protein